MFVPKELAQQIREERAKERTERARQELIARQDKDINLDGEEL